MTVAFLLALAFATPAFLVFAAIKLTEAENAHRNRPGRFSAIGALIYWCAVGYTALLFAGILVGILVAMTTEYGDKSIRGCYFDDALIYGVHCQGFFGSSAVSALLNFALQVVQFSAISLSSPISAPIALVLWAPPLYVLYRQIQRLRQRKQRASEVHHNTPSQ